MHGMLVAMIAGHLGRALALIGLMLWPTGGIAQEVSKAAQAYAAAPADHLLVTSTGVDLRSGRYDYRHTDLTIGGPDHAGLQLTRLSQGGIQAHREAFGNFSHNYDIVIAEKRVDILKGRYTHRSGIDFRMTVKYNAQLQTFDVEKHKPGFDQITKGNIAWLTYVGDRVNGSTVYTFRATDGTTVLFRPIGDQATSDCSTALRCAYASEVRKPDGTVLALEYDTTNLAGLHATRLRSVSSSRGYAMLFEYEGGGGGDLVTKACVINLSRTTKPGSNLCPSDAVATSRYAYGGHGGRGLTSVVDPSGSVWRFEYPSNGSDPNGGGNAIGFVKPGQAAPWLINTYHGSDDEDGAREVVDVQTLADGRVYTFTYTDTQIETQGIVRQIAGGEMIDPQGHRISAQYGFPRFPKQMIPGYDPLEPEVLPNPNSPDGDPPPAGTVPVYQMTPGPISVSDQLGRTTTYEYCDPAIQQSADPSWADRCVVGPLRYYVDAEGSRTDVVTGPNGLITSARRRPKPGSNLPDIQVSAYYDCSQTSNSCLKPNTTSDANGGVASFAYTAFGDVEWELPPPPQPGAARPLKLHTYIQKQAHIVGGGGAPASIGTPVWLASTMTQCQTAPGIGPGRPAGTPSCDPAQPSIVTGYEYGADGTADNLLLRGVVVTADGQSRRTCYRYDVQGNKIAETTPRAGLATCR